VKRWHTALLVTALALLFLLAWYFDRTLALAARDLDPTTFAIFRQITRLGRSEWYLIPTGIGTIVGFVMLRRAPSEAWRRFTHRCLWVFAAISVSGIATNILKILFGRARPRLLDTDYGMSWFRFGSDWASFPSGHSNTAVAVALAIGLLWPAWRRPLLVVAAIVAASRVVIGAHYLSDTLAGAAVAVATTLYLARWFRRKGWGDLPGRPE
jgi:undecaprenyl-diphosphatase